MTVRSAAGEARADAAATGAGAMGADWTTTAAGLEARGDDTLRERPEVQSGAEGRLKQAAGCSGGEGTGD